MKKKVPGLDPNFTPGRVPGIVTLTISPKWGTYIKRWQGPRKVPLTPLQQAVIQQFKDVAVLVKNCSAQDYEAARELSRGTPLLPRDILTKAAYGTLIEVQLTDGTLIQGRRVVNTQAQQLLDSISPDPGSILVRTSSGWVGLPAERIGTVLQSQGAGQPPQYGDPSTGFARGSLTSQPGDSGFTGQAAACQGQRISPIFDQLFTTFGWYANFTSGVDYHVSVYELSGFTILGQIADAGPFNYATATAGLAVIQWPTPIPLAAGNDYAVTVRASNQVDSYALALRYQSQAMQGLYINDPGEFIWLAKASPAVADTFSNASPFTARFQITLQW